MAYSEYFEMKDDIYNEKYYKDLEYGLVSEERSDHRKILGLLKVYKLGNVLEIGCGFGVLLEKIPCKRKIGIEISDVPINECCKRGLNVIKGDVTQGISFKDSCLDVVIMNEVLEHLKNTKYILEECFRVLKKGGLIFITTPVRHFLTRNLDRTHISEMAISDMKRLMQVVGFKVLKHEVSGVFFVYPILEFLFFKPFRYLKEKRSSSKYVIDKGRALADQTFLKPLSWYRKRFLWFGQNQLIFAKRN